MATNFHSSPSSSSSNFHELHTLDVSHNSLTVLSRGMGSLAQYHKLKNYDLSNNAWMMPPGEIRAQGESRFFFLSIFSNSGAGGAQVLPLFLSLCLSLSLARSLLLSLSLSLSLSRLAFSLSFFFFLFFSSCFLSQNLVQVADERR